MSPYGDTAQKSKSKAGGWPRSPATSGDTCEPDEARGEFAVGSMEKNRALLREPFECLGSHQSPPTTPGLEPASRAARQSAFGRRCRALGARAARATNIGQFRDSICCSNICGQPYEGVRQPPRPLDGYTSVRLARCWAPRRRAAGHAAAPPRQIRRDAAAAPGRPPTELWLPSRGRAQVSRRLCGRRHLRRQATPHR